MNTGDTSKQFQIKLSSLEGRSTVLSRLVLDRNDGLPSLTELITKSWWLVCAFVSGGQMCGRWVFSEWVTGDDYMSAFFRKNISIKNRQERTSKRKFQLTF